MHRSGAVIGAIAAALVLALLAGCGPYPQPTAKGDCASEVLSDWSDGGIDGVYDEHCYIAAIDALPEDLRAYTSAGDDIERALRSRRAPTDDPTGDARRLAEATVPEATVPDAGHATRTNLGGPPLAVVLLGGILVVVATAGLASFALRRHRGSP